MSEIDVDALRAALTRTPPSDLGANATRRAAVAAIVRADRVDPEVLLIRRAERADDPWSGHMAFPGGRVDPTDEDLVATAVRETREEVGLDLRRAGELVGRLDDIVPGGSRGLDTSFVVSGYLWVVREVPPLRPETAEVDEIHWAALGPMLRGERETTFPYRWKGQLRQFPGYRVGPVERERVVWGMTHRMLEMLFARVRAGPR